MPVRPGASNMILEEIQLAHVSSRISAAPDPTSQPQSEESELERGKFRVIAIFSALSLSCFIAALDQTIVSTIIPTIVSELHAPSGYVWVGGAYLLANAAAGNIWANLSDIWGRKPILLATAALFFGASIICAKSTDMTMMIVGRALQGVGGGGLLQLVIITISDLFSVRHRSLYFGLLECVWALAGAIGPLMGGALTEAVSWRWAYWINLPVAGTSIVLIFFFLDIHNPRTKFMDGIKAIDWTGSVSILGLTLMLLLGLNFGGSTFAWSSPQVICLIVLGSLMSLVFIYCEKKLAKYPLMPLSVFKTSSNVACFVIAFCQGAVFMGGEYYLPLYFQSTKAASPLQSGLLILPIVLMTAFSAALTGYLIHLTGRYVELLQFGNVMMTVGTGLYINFATESSLAKLILYQIVAGLGVGCLFTAPTIAMQANVSQSNTASATATLNFIRTLATAVSAVVGGVVFQNSMALRKPALLAAGLSANQTEAFAGEDATANVLLIESIADPVQRRAVRDAFSWSLRNLWIMYTCIAVISVVASMFVRKTHLSKDEEHTETKTGLTREKTDQINLS
ncbi:putative MFS transporter [Talaromyces proteolyticus]|uniref:MFS transporter n=1 Tax=Talaromyces proteolyticus TaxID=1131652 RepID=A0AAD4L2P1_9EURO|nr:putative MFS transporter [Talaromyces proteolyticus]KAH8705495.1 putative MFS transporter [Talaromyces proteolyticus]